MIYEHQKSQKINFRKMALTQDYFKIHIIIKSIAQLS